MPRPNERKAPQLNELNDGETVRELERHWASICDTLLPTPEDELCRLLEAWAPLVSKDPITSTTDLLSPLGQAFKETSHTQVLAYLLDPLQGHGLTAEPLQCFLDYVFLLLGSGDQPRFEVATKDVKDASVAGERSSLLVEDEDEKDDEAAATKVEKRPRTDLWIELPAVKPRVLVVVENKIGDQARPRQLETYERAIAVRLKHLHGHPPLVVKLYLTLDGHEPATDAGGTGWLRGSFWELGLCFLRVLNHQDCPGVDFLRLYLATIFRRLYSISYESNQSRHSRFELLEYLRIRVRPEAQP